MKADDGIVRLKRRTFLERLVRAPATYRAFREIPKVGRLQALRCTAYTVGPWRSLLAAAAKAWRLCRSI